MTANAGLFRDFCINSLVFKSKLIIRMLLTDARMWLINYLDQSHLFSQTLEGQKLVSSALCNSVWNLDHGGVGTMLLNEVVM